MPSLSDKLRALGVKTGAPDQITPPHATESGAQQAKQENSTLLDETLGGRQVHNAQGETYVVEARFPNNSLSAEFQSVPGGLLENTGLQMRQAPRILAAWAGEPRLAELAPQAFAFLDTETTGLSGGTGTYAFLIGVGRYEADAFHLAQIFMRDPIEEPADLYALEEFLAPCQAIVTFNGKSFDVPLLNTRYLTQGWRTPFVDLFHVDLLHLARRLWRDRLPSRTLGNLEAHILGTERTGEDIPGWAIPQMYFDYLRSADPAPLKSVFYHNAMDVVSLAALFNHMADLLANPFEATILHGVDLIALARLCEDLGDLDLAVQLYLQGLDYEDRADSPIELEYRLSRTHLVEAIQRLALIYKRRADYPAALPLWEKAAQHAHIEAHIELAKFYEHQMRDYSAALNWVLSANEIINAAETALYERLRWQAELEARLNRLQTKLKRSSGF